MFESLQRPVWWLPSLGFFLFLAFELGMFLPPAPNWPFSAEHIFQDPGAGRHLRTAEAILETGRVPRSDPLSFNRAGEPWIDFEWGFEATVGELYRLGGLGLVAGFCFGVFGATLLGVYRTVLQRGSSLAAVLFVTTLVFLTLHIHFSARPVIFTYLFMALVVEVWNRRSAPLTRDWLLLPIVFVAWANLHAGWLAALVFLALAIGGRVMDRLAKRSNGVEAPVIPWIGLSLLCLGATLVNPWGWKLHRHVFAVATGLKSAAMWDEYRPPDFSIPSMSAIAIMVVVAAALVAWIFRFAPVWKFEALFPALFFLYEGLKFQRHVLFLVIIAAVWVARDLDAILAGVWRPRLSGVLKEWVDFFAGRFREFQATQRTAGADAWLALVFATLLALLFVHWPVAWNIRVGEGITPQVLAFLRAHPDRFHRPLTTTTNAGPLLWNLRPDFRVSFDDRGDFYGDKTVYSFVDLLDGAPGWQDKLAQGNYDSLIIDPYFALNRLLHSRPEWKEVYRDKYVVVYWKD